MKRILPYIFIVLVWFVFSYPFLLFGKAPFPSRYQVNFFAPWTGYPELAGPVKNNAMPDIITQIYPWKHFSIESLKKGTIPLWNPYSFSGTPHLANYQSSVFFPLNVLFFLPIKFLTAWSILVILQPLLAGVCMYLYMRTLKISSSAGLISAISFMFCGFLTTWMGYANLGYSILFLPLALYVIEKYREKGKIKYLVFLSFSICASFLAGHFQTSLYSFGVVILYTIFVCLFVERKKANLLPFLFILLGLLLSLIQILPSIELYGLSVRSDIFQKIETIPWNYFPTFFAPDFFGNPVTRNAWYGHYAEWNGYAGLVTICLAFFAIFFKRSKYVLFFSFLAVASLLLAFNTPILDLVLSFKLPVLSTSAASRVIVLFSFAIAILGGFGFDLLFSFIKNKKRKHIIFWFGLSSLFFVYFWSVIMLKLLDPEKLQIAKSNLLLPTFIFLSFFGIIFLTSYVSKKYINAIQFLLLILLAFEMVRFAAKWQPFEPSSLVFKDVPVTNYYSKLSQPDRVFNDFTAENSVYYHLQSLGGYDPLYVGRYGEFVNFVADGKISQGARSAVSFSKNGKFTPQALDFLGAKYIIHKTSDGNNVWAFPFSKYPLDKFSKIFDQDNIQVFQNKTAFSRAFLVFSVVKEANDKIILKKMFSSDLRNTGFVEKDTAISSNGNGSTEIISYLPNKITINTNSSENALLILTDNYYPDWNVYINDKKSELLRADYTFRGVVVPSGKSLVEFRYEPKSFRNGLLFFILAFVGIIISMGIAQKKGKLW